MDTGAHARVSELARAALVLVACSADIVCNYPLWIYAKRAQAGLGRPALRDVYKGAGSLLCACGPMIAVQDRSTGAIVRALEGGGHAAAGSTAAHATAACVSGAVGALVVGSQVESVITRAHARDATVWATLRRTHAAGGLLALAAPRGTLMVAAREVPYAGVLFFLSGWIRAHLGGAAAAGRDAPAPARRRVAVDVLTALCSAAIAGPLSHAPAVIASQQQAHAATISAACRDIAATGGWRAFYRGIVPRTVTLAGSLFVIPASIELLQPWLETSPLR